MEMRVNHVLGRLSLYLVLFSFCLTAALAQQRVDLAAARAAVQASESSAELDTATAAVPKNPTQQMLQKMLSQIVNAAPSQGPQIRSDANRYSDPVKRWVYLNNLMDQLGL